MPFTVYDLLTWPIHGQWRTQEICSVGGQQIQLKIEGRENGDLGAVAS
jgi:hypothetical protein